IHRGKTATPIRHARIATEVALGHCNRLGFLVHEQQPTGRSVLLLHAACTSRTPIRAIQAAPVRTYHQSRKGLRVQHRDVIGAVHFATGTHRGYSANPSIASLISSSPMV